MAQSVQHNRFVASLIRALATKDQQLTALRAQTRRLAPHSSPQGELSQKEIDCCSLQEPQSPGMQRAYLQARIVDLEERVGKLGEEAEREGGLRREWQSKVEELQQREQEYEARIQDLADRLLREEEEGRKWRQQAQALTQQEALLKGEIQSLRVEAQYERILQSKIQSLTKNLLEWQKFQQRVRQNIDAIIRKHCAHATPELQASRGKGELIEQIGAKLAAIEHALQMQHIPTFPSGGCLDHTLQELLVLMEPVIEEEASLECSGGEKEGRGSDCHSDNTTAVREAISNH